MKRILLLTILLTFSGIEIAYAQIIPVDKRVQKGILDTDKKDWDLLEKNIVIIEKNIRSVDTTFASLTEAMSGISDEQWRKVRRNLYLGNSSIVNDSISARWHYNQCLLEKHYLLNYRNYEKKTLKVSNSINFGLNSSYGEESLQLDDGIDERKLLNCTWKQVWDALHEDDLAIEFTIIDSKEYALLLDKSHIFPILLQINLPESYRQITIVDDIYDDNDGAIDFWGDCLNYMVGKKRIFFSPSSRLNHVAVEYLQLNGKTLFETYDLYRVSSSREICKQRLLSSKPEIFIYGNIKYNAGVDVKRGDNLGQLPNTKAEIDSIASVLNGKASIHTFERMSATEQCFRSLSDSTVTMLHIASHGQYKASPRATEQEAMRGSVLAFCGYNIWGADPMNDGKVTAEDISSMNLGKCELVVLSACQTGLGAGGLDGVYGLQRGFKSAGADAIMMSIRDVHDEATAQLMTAFYRELAKGKSKREALKKAMEEIRSIDKYKKAEYWASFIMLDGLD